MRHSATVQHSAAGSINLQAHWRRPEIYIAELLTRLGNGWPQWRIDELMLWHWATTQVD